MFDVCCVSVEAQDCIVNSVALSFVLHMDEPLSRGDAFLLCPLSPLLVEKMPNESDMIWKPRFMGLACHGVDSMMFGAKSAGNVNESRNPDMDLNHLVPESIDAQLQLNVQWLH